MASPLLIAQHSATECALLPGLANRHGLITGATGTGKTVTLQKLAESFSQIGVPVFMADVKGDLSGISQNGKVGDKLAASLKDRGIELPDPLPAPPHSGMCSGSKATRCAPPFRTWGPCSSAAC